MCVQKQNNDVLGAGGIRIFNLSHKTKPQVSQVVQWTIYLTE